MVTFKIRLVSLPGMYLVVVRLVKLTCTYTFDKLPLKGGLGEGGGGGGGLVLKWN